MRATALPAGSVRYWNGVTVAQCMPLWRILTSLGSIGHKWHGPGTTSSASWSCSRPCWLLELRIMPRLAPTGCQAPLPAVMAWTRPPCLSRRSNTPDTRIWTMRWRRSVFMRVQRQAIALAVSRCASCKFRRVRSDQPFPLPHRFWFGRNRLSWRVGYHHRRDRRKQESPTLLADTPTSPLFG